MGCRESVVLPSTVNCGDLQAINKVTGSDAAAIDASDSSMIWITTRQKQLIRSTWSTLASNNCDFEQLGSEVFLRIFHRHPELLHLFPFGDVESQLERQPADQHVSSLQLIQSHPAFRSHMVAFVNSIAMAVNTMDDWDGLLTDTLLTLGASHSKTQGFTVQNFEAFAESLIYVWKKHLTAIHDEDKQSGDSRNSKLGVADTSLTEVIHAWEILFIFILMKLRDGYQMMRRLSRSKNVDSTSSSQMTE